METYQPPSADVVKWQQFLKASGVYQGEVTGTWDEATWAALSAWQEKMQIGQSGQIDQATTGKLQDVVAYVSGQPEDPLRKKVRELYGPAMVAYLSHPEIGPILKEAADQGFDPGRLRGRLEQTNWWRTNDDNARQWDEFNISDPESANAQRRAKSAFIADVAGKMGVTLSEQMKTNIVEDSLRLGLSEGEVTDMVSSMAQFNPNKPASEGNIAAYVDQLRIAAKSLYLSPPEAELFEQAKRIAGGGLTLDGAIATFREQAKLNHPALAPSIDAGSTVEDYFAETKRRIANALEVDPTSIDLMGDRRFWPIMGFVDGKGRNRPMTWSESIQFVNRMPEADKTDRLNQKAAQLGQLFRQTFKGVN